METDDAAVLNAVCLNKLTMNMIRRIDIEFQRKIAVNDASVKCSAEKMNILIDSIYELIERGNYKRALLFLCMLSQEMKKAGVWSA